ncbi:hypothetical protein [Taibaiella chishuiensis]|uniref:Uncharacterized protein n=1 Tax=Taibaiella chishuiensis TaxID=1434707 RepID=A0A2P8D2T0_9BACT|nr:hypothetical protein [Taibaiella chishuiensis]PSK91532.1 hypothetical protein B0I18_105115 [Taibaiella chishuiensis]
MRNVLALLVFFVLAGTAHRAQAGSITFYNFSGYNYEGYLIGSNTWPSSYSTYYEQYVVAPAGTTTVGFADPTALPSPSGPGLPALSTGMFVGMKGFCTGAGLPSNNGAVGRVGNHMGYPTNQSTPGFYSVQWNPGGSNNDAIIVLLP